MFKSSPASRAGVAPAGDNSRNEPVSSRSRFGRCGLTRHVCKGEAPVTGGNDQKLSVCPEEKPDTVGLQKKKFRAVPATTISRECPTAAEKDNTVVRTQTCAATVTDEVSPGASAGNASGGNFQHKECYSVTWPGHTDACWNDPRWSEKNREKREEIAQNIQSGFYRDSPVTQFTVMSSDQRYKTELAVYASRKQGRFGYSNIRIIRCEDAKVLANINRDIEALLCSPFQWNGDQCILTGHSHTSPLVVNLNTEKIYQQRGDQYDSWELIWHSVEASPDGRTFLAEGLIWGGWPAEYRFYDASKPDQGFRFLPPGLTMVIPDDKDATSPQWGVDENGQTTVSLTIRKGYDEDDCVDERGNPVVFKKTFRRAEDRMVEVASETIPIRTDISDDEDN